MSYACEILADSISPTGHRLTTFQVTYPRIVLAEMNTHRMFSRNTSSSRAIPVQKQIAKVGDDPFIPVSFGKNQRGMVASTDLNDKEASIARDVWQDAIDGAVDCAICLTDLEVHKQLANRVIEPYTWITQIITATDWDNFWKLRCAPEAQPEIRTIAEMMLDAYQHQTELPQVGYDYWHLPLTTEEERDFYSNKTLTKISIGRCARVSYLTHDGTRDPDADIALYARLWESGHLSPFEHVARPFSEYEIEFINEVRYFIQKHPNHASQFGAQQSQFGYIYNHLDYVGNLKGWVSKRMSLEVGL